MTPDRPAVRLPESELSWRFSRSSGPGGQHVNTSETRVELRWDPRRSTVLSPTQQARVIARLAHRMVDGHVVVIASEHRSQLRNREAARRRLEELVATALTPRRRRRPTRPSRAAVERGREAKRRRSRLKQNRRAW